MTRALTAADLTTGAELPSVEIAISTKAIIMGATASRDWQPLHHDHVWAVERGGLPGVIANNYTQSGWISRCVTGACGPATRIARLRLRMRKPISSGDTIVFHAKVAAIEPRDAASCWIQLDVDLKRAAETVTTASLLAALPARPGDPSPWRSNVAAPPLKPSSM